MTELNTPKDYMNLYKKMGCTDFISYFFHMYDNIGVMTRVVHWSKAYALTINYDKELHYCGKHNAFHSRMVTDRKEFITICPEADPEDPNSYRPHPKYYPGPKASRGLGFIQPNVQGNDIWDDIYKTRVFYNSTYLWDPIVLDYKNNGNKFRQTEKLDYIRAYVPTMEIDAKGGQDKRKDMLDKEIFADFDTADGYIKDKFKSEFDGRFSKRTSANGMYYQGIPIVVKSPEHLDEMMLGFQDLCYEIEDYFTQGEDLVLKNIIFDIDSVPGWNKYFKCPFSLHRKFDRIALPLSPNKHLDYDYIKTYSNPENINAEAVRDIVKEAGYSWQ